MSLWLEFNSPFDKGVLLDDMVMATSTEVGAGFAGSWT